MNMGKEKGHSNYSSSPSFWDVALELAAFGLVGFYLALSSVIYFLWSHFLFDGLACVPVLQLFGLSFPTMEFAGCWVEPNSGGDELSE